MSMIADFDDFMEAMKNKRGNIKSALMDQSHVSGIGNIYADEVLYQEKLHPEAISRIWTKKR